VPQKKGDDEEEEEEEELDCLPGWLRPAAKTTLVIVIGHWKRL